jgi:VanZ family protein
MTMPSSGTSAAQLELRYSVLTVAAVVAIFLLSSMPGLSAPEREPLLALAWNLAHVPAFAALAFLLLKAISGTVPPSWDRYILAFFGSVAYAAFDEWHQSFVPLRIPSIGDFLLDIVGIGGVLLVLRLSASWTREVRAMPQPVTRP